MGSPEVLRRNLTNDVLDRYELAPDAIALRRKVAGQWHDITITEFIEQVRTVAASLIADGIAPGDRVAIMSKTRYEWTVLDYALWWVGAISVPIYPTGSVSHIGWVLQDCGASIIFADTKYRNQLASAQAEFELEVALRSLTQLLDEYSALGEAVPEDEIEHRRQSVGPDDLATLIYTSGTTGSPKGCMLTHANFDSELADAIERLSELFERDHASTLLFLPLAHIFARIVQIGAIRAGVTLGHSSDITELLTDFQEFRPSFILAVPRVLEKLFNSASALAYAQGRGMTFDRAAKTAIAFSRATDRSKVPLSLRLRHAAYDRLVYRQIRDELGGKAEYVISGGAPLGDRLGHFFRGIGVTVLEGYGLTESTAALTVNTPNEQRVGTVGKPFRRTEARIGAGSELQFRGPQVFSGYWNDPESTSLVLDPDGWLLTGDIGEIDADGFVKVTGRTKEILVTAGGKNVSPHFLEEQIRAHPWVSQCLIVGDGRPFVAALVTIDRSAWTGDLDDEELLSGIQSIIDVANGQVSRAESVRKFVVLDTDWTEEDGYLTPSFKLKRQAILRDLHNTIESLYIK